MGAKRPPRPVLQIKGPEAVTQLAHNMQDILSVSEPITPSSSSCSPCSSPPPPGSAVHALQSKVKALSEKEPQETKLLLTQNKWEEASTSSSTHAPELNVSGGKDGDGMYHVRRSGFVNGPSPLGEPRAPLAAESDRDQDNFFISAVGQTRGVGEGASLESLLTDDSAGLQGDSPTSRSTSTSSRTWAPPKGFWRVARPETLLFDGEHVSGDMLLVGGEGPPRRPKMKATGVELRRNRRELHHADSLECHHRRRLQQEVRAGECGEELWSTDRLDVRSATESQGTPTLSERTERNQGAVRQVQSLRKHHTKGLEVAAADANMQHCAEEDARLMDSSGMFSDGDSELVYTVSPYEFEQIYRCIVTDDLPLSPRHEQAKRLLERARLKARCQFSKSEQSARSSPGKVPPRQGPKYLPLASPPLHKALLVAAQEEIAIAPIKIVDSRGRECERGARPRRVGQSPTRVRFQDESEKEAERRYLERVRLRGPVVTEKSHNTATTSKSDHNRGVSTATIRQDDQGAGSVVGKCEACGSLLGIIIAKDAHGKPKLLSSTDNQGKFGTNWVSTGLFGEPESYSTGDGDAAAGQALADNMASDNTASAGEDGGVDQQVSGFGKLRRRSLKGERRDDAGHVLGPYARSQDLWAQRRNSYSKMRASMEEASLLYAQRMPAPPQGVTFAVDLQSPLARPAGAAAATPPGILKDTSSPQLPLKSALKNSSKNQPSAQQRVVTLVPSVQYRLVHLDQEKEGKPHHIELSADEQLTVTAVTSSPTLTPCIKQSSLRYTAAAKATTDLLTPGSWDASSEAVAAHLTVEDPMSAPVESRAALRGTKADDLRSELLRAEHRKAEVMWDDMPESARRAMMDQEGKSKLSLRRFFSAMGLNSMGKMVKGNRSSSMDQLCSPSARHGTPAINLSASPSPSPSHRTQTRLQRTPSLQSLHTESPLAQLRKVSSVQSLQSPKRLKERSTILGPVPYNLSPREFDQDPCLGDPEIPRSGPQGRLVQAYPDGTLLIELSRPANGPFGFVISRGKGRPGSGVFVEHVGDNSADSIYTGLLGVGDEILEVNGEMVAGLALDQVTRLMTRDSTASIRVIPHRWIQS
ncbi:uncharacterized protein si:ch211-13f8.1 [Engraulis encrasicolus]|uniref:uncharacterized protein si:ch211-13f8.1 n=1 Tax=Engraulis encrasicolus TaxID=184585 RepID=UPI002FD096E6